MHYKTSGRAIHIDYDINDNPWTRQWTTCTTVCGSPDLGCGSYSALIKGDIKDIVCLIVPWSPQKFWLNRTIHHSKIQVKRPDSICIVEGEL